LKPGPNPGGIEEFRDMGRLPERVALFEKHLWEIKCERDDWSCSFSSQIEKMCPVCQIKMFFFHNVRNWDAYHPNSKGFVGSFIE
jgi:hypothetical protein